MASDEDTDSELTAQNNNTQRSNRAKVHHCLFPKAGAHPAVCPNVTLSISFLSLIRDLLFFSMTNLNKNCLIHFHLPHAARQSMDSSDLSDGPITLQEYLEVKKALASSEAKVQQLMKVNNNLSEELRRLQKEVRTE